MRLLNPTGGDYATLLTNENIQHATNNAVRNDGLFHWSVFKCSVRLRLSLYVSSLIETSWNLNSANKLCIDATSRIFII